MCCAYCGVRLKLGVAHLCYGHVVLPPVLGYINCRCSAYNPALDPDVWGPPPDPAGDLLRGMGIAVREDDPR